MMEYRRLGRSGLMISKIALGTMNFGNPTDREESFRIIDAALDGGVNLFDCADAYSEGESERILGEAFCRNGRREEIFLTSKVFMRTGDGPNDGGNSRHHVLAACEKSLRRLHTDYIDIYFLHRTDFSVPQEEILAALDLLVRQGKVRHIGCSTHPPWRVVEAYWIADRHHFPKFVSEQPPYNLLDRRAETEIIPMCRAYDLGIISWSPLAQGVLAGRYRDATKIPPGSRGALKKVYAERITQQGIAVAQSLAERAKAKGCTLPQFAAAWVLHQKGITATIVGPRTLEHFKDLIGAVDVSLDASDREFCDSLVPPGTHVSDHFNSAGWRTGDPPSQIPSS
jgi:aryl-alcohol dehydrogenase-like predicted oxidoreductase